MIALIKGEEPQILKENAATWTKELLASIDPTDTQKNRYNHKDIKDALKKETHGKCAYCESKLGVTSFGDIEHISPKKLDLSKSFEWNNLTLACSICNNGKSDMAINSSNFVDPYQDNPNDHFYFSGSFLLAKEHSEAAQAMILKLKLGRDELTLKRFHCLEGFFAILSKNAGTLKKFPSLETRNAMWDEVKKQYTSDSVEYAMMKRFAVIDFEKNNPLFNFNI